MSPAVARLVAQAVAQGLPEHVRDQAALRRVAAVATPRPGGEASAAHPTAA